MGLTGLPIREVIIQLERELREECLRELDLAYRQMPFKALIPLLFFQFPALLLLVLGPIVKEFVFGIGNA